VRLKTLVEELYPLHRTLASEGTDDALEIVAAAMPSGSGFEIEAYTPGDPVWTWKVPERYRVDEAWVQTADGQRVIDFADSPLHLVSYSEPIDAELSWTELEPHLHVADHRPSAIPWEFRFYERSWGFCLCKEDWERLDRNARYRVRIDSKFVTGAGQGLRVGAGTIHPDGRAAPDGAEIIICAHICHPAQANDDAAGVATAVGVAQRLAERPLPPGSASVRFLFCPETIGSICYFAHHEELIPRLRGGVFVEMTGNDNTLVLQRTRQDDSRLDRIARAAFRKRFGDGFREGGFREVISNDEMVINGPGVDAPCISVSRWPYPEYHTSDDCPAIIGEDRLQEAAQVVEEIVRVAASDYVPRRRFKGPVFLSGHGLWIDWRENPELNLALEKLMLSLEGDQSVYEIADELSLDYWETRSYIERFREADLVTIATPVEGRPPR
jgi:aminopeptidase-like protein